LCDAAPEEPPFVVIRDVGSIIFIFRRRSGRPCFDIVVLGVFDCGGAAIVRNVAV
jgi:hypothetical protein